MADFPILSGIFDKMRDYEREVIDDKILGHGLRTLSQGIPLGPGGRTRISLVPPMIAPIMKLLTPDDKYSRYANLTGLTGKAWVDEAYKESPWQHFGASALLDPTNLIGFGLPGAAAKALPVGSKIAKGLEMANVVDQFPGKATGKGFELLGNAGRGALQGAADTLGPMVPKSPALDKLGRVYGKTMQGWREQALFSGSYPVGNWMGNIDAAVRSGQGDVIKSAIMAPFTGRSKVADEVLTSLGNNRPKLNYASTAPPPPIDPMAFNSRWADEMAKLGREPNIHNPMSTPSVVRDIPDTFGAANTVRDKAAGVSEWFKRANQNRIEGPAIDAAFMRDFMPKIDQAGRDMETVLRGIKTPTGTANPVAQKAADELVARNYRMSPDDLREILFPGTRARRARAAANPTPYAGPRKARVPDWRDGVIAGWENNIIDSVQAGTKNSTDIFFDYTANNPIDKLGQGALAFHRFAVNNIPKTITAAGKNPVYANIPSEYYRVSDEYNKQHGLPRSFHGQYPLGGPGADGTQASFDPMGRLPFGALAKYATRPGSPVDDQNTPVGEFAEDLKGIGLGLNPFIDALLTVTGQHGRGLAPGFLRASQPVNGILSSIMDRPVDIEGGPKELLGNAQEAITGQRPFPYQEYLLRKRQAELKAMGKDPKQAGSQLGDQMATEGLAGFAGVPGLKLLTPEEQEIRRNAALAQAYKLAGNTAGYRANPTSRAYADLDPRDEQIANFSSLSADERRRLLRDPEVRDQLLEKLAMQLHNTGTTGKPNPNPFARPTQAATRERVAALTAPRKKS